MALRTPPSWLQGGSHPAENDRLTTQAILASAGVMRQNDLKVSQSATPAMSVDVTSGWAVVTSNSYPNGGMYVAFNDASVTLSVTAANSTFPRIDLVVVTVQDAYYSGSSNTVTMSVIAGTPSASPTVPATPDRSVALAQIAVGAAVTSITNANITDVRVRAQMQDITFGGSGVATVPLTIKTQTSQTANNLEIKNASGSVIGWIDQNGALGGTLAAGTGFNPFLLMGA